VNGAQFPALQQKLLEAESLFGNTRLKFNADALNRAYLSKAAEAAKGLDPSQAAQLGLYNDATPQSSLVQLLLANPGTTDMGARLLDMDRGHKTVEKDYWQRKPKEIEG
jgi:hypothetical protein